MKFALLRLRTVVAWSITTPFDSCGCISRKKSSLFPTALLVLALFVFLPCQIFLDGSIQEIAEWTEAKLLHICSCRWSFSAEQWLQCLLQLPAAGHSVLGEHFAGWSFAAGLSMFQVSSSITSMLSGFIIDFTLFIFGGGFLKSISERGEDAVCKRQLVFCVTSLFLDW